MKKMSPKPKNVAAKMNSDVIKVPESKTVPTLEEIVASIPGGGIELTDEDRQFLNSTEGRESIEY